MSEGEIIGEVSFFFFFVKGRDGSIVVRRRSILDKCSPPESVTRSHCINGLRAGVKLM